MLSYGRGTQDSKNTYCGALITVMAPFVVNLILGLIGKFVTALMDHFTWLLLFHYNSEDHISIISQKILLAK